MTKPSSGISGNPSAMTRRRWALGAFAFAFGIVLGGRRAEIDIGIGAIWGLGFGVRR